MSSSKSENGDSRADWIITGASRGIGRALTMALAARAGKDERVFVVARDAERLRVLVDELGGRAAAIPIVADLSRPGEARGVGERLAKDVRPGAVLVHNAGLWPNQLELVDGMERAFATNCICPLSLQEPLLAAARLSRVLVIGAGLMIKGRFLPDKTPLGRDFSTVRTYCNTKLAGAVAMRDVARRHPQVDIAVVHPGVVNTDLGARGGVIGTLLRFIKRRWESPEVCAARLVRLLDRPRWQHSSGEAPWFVEEEEQPWPPAAIRDEKAIVTAVESYRLGADKKIA